MKKILFTLLLVAGSFGAQAQDLPTLELTLFNGSSKALVVGHTINNRCVDVKSASGSNDAITDVGVTLTYAYNSATGVVTRNGSTIETATEVRRKAQLNAIFGGSFNNLYAFENRAFRRLTILEDN